MVEDGSDNRRRRESGTSSVAAVLGSLCTCRREMSATRDTRVHDLTADSLAKQQA